MTTASGEIMLRIKAMCVVGVSSERVWRNSRANSLARMIAWHVLVPSRIEARARTKAIILEDIIPDIGWPRWTWLKPAVRAAQAEIKDNLTDAGLWPRSQHALSTEADDWRTDCRALPTEAEWSGSGAC